MYNKFTTVEEYILFHIHVRINKCKKGNQTPYMRPTGSYVRKST